MKKISFPIAAALLAGSAIFPAPTPVEAAQCTGPFVPCAIAVQATCSRDADGGQRMTYWDQSGNTIQFERCVGRIFEAAGQPNPYKTGITSSGNLTVPRTELLYPFGPP